MSKIVPFIDLDNILRSKAPGLNKWLPKFIINYFKRIIHQDEMNQFIAENRGLDALAFSNAVRNKFNVELIVKGLENIPKSGNCIAVANHPLGGLDAIAIIPELAKIRTDFKYIVNDILLNIKELESLFVGVNKVGSNSINSLKKVEELFASKQLIVLFPAGLVSRKIKGKVIDLAWKKTFVSKAKKYNTPIIPIYIDGKLSNFFYNFSNFRKFLGLKTNLEMSYLPDELFNQYGKVITYTIGKPIDINSFDKNLKEQQIADEIKKQLYQLA